MGKTTMGSTQVFPLSQFFLYLNNALIKEGEKDCIVMKITEAFLRLDNLAVVPPQCEKTESCMHH